MYITLRFSGFNLYNCILRTRLDRPVIYRHIYKWHFTPQDPAGVYKTTDSKLFALLGYVSCTITHQMIKVPNDTKQNTCPKPGGIVCISNFGYILVLLNYCNVKGIIPSNCPVDRIIMLCKKMFANEVNYMGSVVYL